MGGGRASEGTSASCFATAKGWVGGCAGGPVAGLGLVTTPGQRPLPLPCAGQWQPFTGNEIGAMLAEWVLRKYRARKPSSSSSAPSSSASASASAGKLAVLSSTVSSRMLQAMAAKEGVHWEETLTGGRAGATGWQARACWYLHVPRHLTLCPFGLLAPGLSLRSSWALCPLRSGRPAGLMCAGLPALAGFKWLGNAALRLEAEG